MIWRYSDFLWAGDFRVCCVLPVNVKSPDKDSIVLENLLQLCAACRHHDIRLTRRRQSLAVDIRVVEKIRAVNDDALLPGRLALQHLRAISDARVLLDHFVAGTGWNVVAIRPDRRARVVREERPQEFVTIVRAKWIGTGADCITHRIGPLRTRWWRLTARLWRLIELCRRTEKPDRQAGLIYFTGHAY